MKAIKTTIAQSGPSLYIKALICGISTGCVTLIMLLLLFSCLLLIAGTLPHDYLIWLDIAACCFASYISGYLTTRIIKNRGLIWGVVSGFIMFTIQFIAGLINADSEISYLTFIKLAVFVLFGAVGGIKAVNKKDKMRIK